MFFILVKCVIDSILVFWMSMAMIPLSILDCIWRKIMNFMWARKVQVQGGKFHLASWETIYMPKEMGG